MPHSGGVCPGGDFGFLIDSTKSPTPPKEGGMGHPNCCQSRMSSSGEVQQDLLLSCLTIGQADRLLEVLN